MRILITAGNTQTPIDDVRVITNVFSGRTGTQIALAAHDRGHSVCLLTSHPELVADHLPLPGRAWEVRPYRTFDDLQRLMEDLITVSPPDAIIHCAAVSDYRLAGTYVPAMDTSFDSQTATWKTRDLSGGPTLVDASAGKVKSNHSELWMRMVPTPKLIDSIRKPWGFRGTLVKFKLEVGPTDAELLRIAEASRQHSEADFIVANTHAGMREWAYLGPVSGQYVRVERNQLAECLLNEIERLASPV